MIIINKIYFEFKFFFWYNGGFVYWSLLGGGSLCELFLENFLFLNYGFWVFGILVFWFVDLLDCNM